MLKSRVKSGEISPEEVIKAANERFFKVHKIMGEMTEVDLDQLSAFERFLDNELWLAYLDARKNKRGTEDEQEFEMLERENLTGLRESVATGKYKPSRGIAFVNFKPVIREIYAAPFRDRVIHHFLYRQSAAIWDRWFINDSYSCRKGKGTLYGVKRIQKFIKSASKNGRRKAYALQFDISSYFMSLDRRKLFKAVKEALRRQFPDYEHNWKYDLLLSLWKEVIFDDPTEGVIRRGKASDWDKVPRGKRMDCQPPGKGIVIGNLTSQLLSNLYLSKLDWFITHELGWKRYGRYVDDFVIIVTEEELERALADKPKIVEFLAGLGLKIHPTKTATTEVHKGVKFLGIVIYPTHAVLAKRFRRSFWEAAVETGMGYRDMESVIAYIGLSCHYNTRKLREKMRRYWDVAVDAA